MTINFNEELIRVEYVIGEDTVSETLAGNIELPDNKPDILRIVDVTANIINVQTEVEEGGVNITGEIEAGVIYVADVEEPYYQQPVHFLEGNINFSEAIDVPGALSGMSVYTNTVVKRVSFDFIDEDTVEIDVAIQIFVKVTEPKQVIVITDIISDQVEVERELLRVEDVVGEDTVFETITGRINVPAVKPDIERILEANARVLESTASTEREGVMIEGEIEGSALYVGDVEEPYLAQPVHYVEDSFNFDNFVEIAGAEEGMNTHVELAIQRVNYNLLNPRTIELTTVLRKFAKVTEFIQIEIITDLVVVSEAADGECPPSYVVYVVQAGDTLWKIARRYRTTVDALIEANPEINPNNLQIGQKICIPGDIIDPKG